MILLVKNVKQQIKAIPRVENPKYEKKGECLRCGRCCDLRCPYLTFIVLEDLPKGTKLKPNRDFGKNKKIMAVCEIFHTNKTWRHCSPRIRKSFPSIPEMRYPGCGWFFIEKETGNRVKRNCFGEEK